MDGIKHTWESYFIICSLVLYFFLFSIFETRAKSAGNVRYDYRNIL